MSQEQPAPHRFLHGAQLAQALVEHGVISRGDRVRRLIIDVPLDGPAMLYLERVADERVLEVIRDAEGFKVIEQEPIPAES